MGKTTVTCSGCNHDFKPGKAKDLGAGIGAGTVGAAAGSSMGLALMGTAIAATGPVALGAAGLGYALSSQFTKCPECGKVQLK